MIICSKMDRNWKMSVDYRATNNIMVNYRYFIPKLHDMLDELYRACICFEIDLKYGYHHIRMKEVDEWKQHKGLNMICMNC